jgi:hypothetical protein
VYAPVVPEPVLAGGVVSGVAVVPLEVSGVVVLEEEVSSLQAAKLSSANPIKAI